MAAPAWVRFYRDGWRERGREWDVPDGLVAANIDPETGALANEYCPIAHREWFRTGTQPTERCREHDWGFGSWISDLEDEVAERLRSILRRWGRGR